MFFHWMIIFIAASTASTPCHLTFNEPHQEGPVSSAVTSSTWKLGLKQSATTMAGYQLRLISADKANFSWVNYFCLCVVRWFGIYLTCATMCIYKCDYVIGTKLSHCSQKICHFMTRPCDNLISLCQMWHNYVSFDIMSYLALGQFDTSSWKWHMTMSTSMYSLNLTPAMWEMAITMAETQLSMWDVTRLCHFWQNSTPSYVTFLQ
jgi:hypothetical protein